jgi:hypothetical protein
MKVLIVLLAVLGSAPMAFAASAGTYVPVATEGLFVPRGFDDNDDIVVTLAGSFPSTCYQLAHVEIKTERTSNQIQLQQMAYMVSGPCARMLVPFSNTVHLGRLPTGNYVVQTKDTGVRSGLPVSRARIPTEDDYLYAPITNATVMPNGSQLVAYLEGRLTNTCLKLKTINVSYTGPTVQVLPIMELTKKQSDGGPCRNIDQPLRLTKALTRLNRGRYLLHARSLNGHSLNVVFSVDN